ncbi:MAG: GAF domain-containing sensor histidine kinase [Nitrospirales bacterium]|nr:GAF domain-containing sensor histidine kinase [Nitrospirales bacterium]
MNHVGSIVGDTSLNRMGETSVDSEYQLSSLQMSVTDRRKEPRRIEDRRLVQRNRELDAARRMTEELFQHLHTDEQVEKMLATALEVVRAESGSILLANQDSEELVFRHSLGASPVEVGTAIPWNKGIASAVFHSGKPIVISDAKRDRRHYAGIDLLTEHVTRDMIALPLKRWAGKPIGVLEVLNKRGSLLDEEDVAILTIVSALAASSIEQSRLYREAKLAVIVRVLGDVSHDVKNMLMPVLSGAQLLEDELQQQFPQLIQVKSEGAETSYANCRELTSMIVNNARRIQRRVREIADAVKGLTSPPNFAICEISTVVRAVFATLKTYAAEQGVRLEIDGLDTLPVIEADEHRLFTAFYNLINNAIPEIPGGGLISVSGKEDNTGTGILVTVSDNGRGMRPEVRDRLFHSEAISTKQEGTGLGTKIVKDVVDAHGGQIYAESELGVGTTFYLHLPVHPPPPRL